MIYVCGILVFLSGYFLCYREPGYREKYSIAPSDKIMYLIAFPAACLKNVPAVRKVIRADINNLSLMKVCILIYLLCSFLPTYVFLVLDDVYKVTAIWCIMGLFIVAITSIVYFIYDIIMERKWTVFKIFAVVFSAVGAFIMLLMCISAALEMPVYVLVSLAGTGISLTVVLINSTVKLMK